MGISKKNSKQNPSGMYPQRVSTLAGEGAAGFTRVEPWISPERLRNEYLFGIPLVSPITKQVMTDDTLKNLIRRAAATIELKTKVDISPVQRFERLDFDRTKMTQGFSQMQLSHGNISSIQEVAVRALNSVPAPIASIAPTPTGAVRSSNIVTITTTSPHGLLSGQSITIGGVMDATFNGVFTVESTPTAFTFTYSQAGPDATSGNGNVLGTGSEGQLLWMVPLAWIDLNQAHKGLLHFVPLQTAYSSTNVGVYSGAGSILYNELNKLSWIPSYWSIKYISGFSENAIPATFNELIGTYAAMEALSLLGPTLRFNSQSISLDGASQSTSGPGNQLFVVRYQQLQEKAKDLEDLIARRFGKKLFMTHF